MSNPVFIDGNGTPPVLGCAGQSEWFWNKSNGSVSKSVRFPNAALQGINPNTSGDIDQSLIDAWVTEVVAAFLADEVPHSDYLLYWYWAATSDAWNVQTLIPGGSHTIYSGAGWEIQVAYCPPGEEVSSSSSSVSVSSSSSSSTAAQESSSSSSSSSRGFSSSSSSSPSTLDVTSSSSSLSPSSLSESSSSSQSESFSSSSSASSKSSSSVSMSSDSSTSLSSESSTSISSSSGSSLSLSSSSTAQLDTSTSESSEGFSETSGGLSSSSSSSSSSLGQSASSESSSSETRELLVTAADHYVLPHQPDWLKAPTTERLWRAGVDSAMSGAEDRLAVRHNAWLKLQYSVLPFNHVERAKFDARFKAALKTGKITVPHWGRGVAIENPAAVGATSLKLVRSNHGFTDGQYLLIQSSVPAEFEDWDLMLVLSTSGATITIASGLDNAYARGTRVWPLLFGRPIPEPFEILNRARSRYTVSVQFDRRQISAYAYETFEDYDLGEITGSLNGGEGWSGPWVIGDTAAA